LALLYVGFAYCINSSTTGSHVILASMSAICLVAIGIQELGWNSVLGLFIFVVATYLALPLATEKGDLVKAEMNGQIVKQEQDWIAASCPVYKGECGSKHKYACEIKVATVGRIDLGDSVVQSYPTCSK
jgi:hypothetical protein